MYIVEINYFDENKTIHDHDTGQKQDFHTYSVHSGFGKRAIKHKGSKLWNDLSDNLKGIESPCSFTRKLKKNSYNYHEMLPGYVSMLCISYMHFCVISCYITLHCFNFVCIVMCLLMKLFTVVIVKGGQHWWALAFSGSLPLYLYECRLFVLCYFTRQIKFLSSFYSQKRLWPLTL